MRWDEVRHLLPPAALRDAELAHHASVESFLIHRSKALGSAAGLGSYRPAGAPLGDAAGPWHAGSDAATLAVVEAVVAARLAPPCRTGLALMRELEQHIKLLSTGSNTIDELLGGGLRQAVVTEAVGESASGKTQLCLSAAATTAAAGWHVVYIDTTGSFSGDRVAQFITPGAGGQQAEHAATDGFVMRALSRIAVLRAANAPQLLSLLDGLGAALERRQRQLEQERAVRDAMEAGGGGGGGAAAGAGDATDGDSEIPRLLIVDSVSAVLSSVLGSNQHSQGTALVTAVGRLLKQLAEQHRLAVLVTNHVTSTSGFTRGGGGAGEGGGGERAAGSGAAALAGVGGYKPALGEQWRSQPHVRVQLSIDESSPGEQGARLCTLTASPVEVRTQKRFHIHARGLT